MYFCVSDHTSSLSPVQLLGYQHCKLLVSGWQKSQDMQHLFSTPSQEDSHKVRTVSHQFDTAVQRSESVCNLVALAAQIPRLNPPDPAGDEESEDVDGGGYWSNPEDHMTYMDEEDVHSEPTASPNDGHRTTTMVAWSDSEML